MRWGAGWDTQKGFSIGKRVRWKTTLLEQVIDMLTAIAPAGKVTWENKQVVPIHVAGQREPWAAVQTKKGESVRLTLTGPKGHFALGGVRHLGHEPEFDADRPSLDLIRLNFRSQKDLARGDLAAFLRKHLATLEEKS